MLKLFARITVTNKSLQVAGCFIGLFLILIVNREFGVADNGDFSRYIKPFASKPLNFKENWAPIGSDAFTKRFFHEPIFYWSPPVHNFSDPWFSSASSFWAAGKLINDIFFSQNVLNIKYIGLPFFVLHSFALCYLLARIELTCISGVVIYVGMFFIFTDARISAFYNSFYAESLPILALFFMSAYFSEITFSNSYTKSGSSIRIFFGFTALALCISAIFTKRQYLYFLCPSLLLGFFLIKKELKMAPSLKNYARFVFCSLVVSVMFFSIYTNQLANPDEMRAIRTTSYNSIYFGLLVHANDPVEIIKQLDLPQESISLIGTNAFTKNSSEFIDEHDSISLPMLLRAISLEPIAFLKSILSNLNEVGNFNIPLGMVYGYPDKYPPKQITVASLISTHIAMTIPPLIFYGFIFFVVLIVYFPPLALHKSDNNVIMVYMFILFFVFFADTAVSAFDGGQEARKHVLIASISGLLIVNYFLACVVNIFAQIANCLLVRK